VRAAAGAGAAVCCAAAWDVAAVVVAARAAGGAVYVGRGGWDGRRVVAALAARAVRCVLVDEGGVVVGVGGVLLAGAASVDGGRALGARPVVVEVENGLRVEYTEEEGRKGRGGRLTRKRDRDERPAAERVLAFLRRVYLPAGFPATVSSDYLSYTAYRVTQNLASAIMTVLSTEWCVWPGPRRRPRRACLGLCGALTRVCVDAPPADPPAAFSTVSASVGRSKRRRRRALGCSRTAWGT
jgi:hypothetical protein